MKRFSLCISALLLGMGTLSALHKDQQANLPRADDNFAHASDGAFRDGLYLGKLSAERGAQPHVATGRWATAQDRHSFTEGYQRGYNEALANSVALARRASRGE
jgi:hypothetical protein